MDWIYIVYILCLTAVCLIYSKEVRRLKRENSKLFLSLHKARAELYIRSEEQDFIDYITDIKLKDKGI